MKKIDSYYDYVTKIKTNIYQTSTGLRVVESVNKQTVDFDISFVINGGTYYEDQLNVPYGTAHLLEHLPFGNPNSFLKTKKEFIEYKMGSKKKASFYTNAHTTREFIYCVAHGNQNAKVRMLKYLFGQILFPPQNFEKYIEKERKIVLEEKQRRPKDEKWSMLQYEKKIFKDEFPTFTRDALGEIETIKSITAKDLEYFYNKTFTVNNSILAIQTSSKLTKEDIKLIEEFSKQLKHVNGISKLKKVRKPYSPKFGVYTFQDDDRREAFMSFNYFYNFDAKLESDKDYIKDRLYLFLTELIEKVSFDYIREELGLTYDIAALNENELFRTKNRGFSLSFTFDNFEQVLKAIYEMIEVKFEKFLVSDEGKRWFNNILSYYIYLRNNNHNSSYAEQIAVDLLDDTFMRFDYRKAKEIVKLLTPEMLLNFTKKFFTTPPAIWINSKYSEDEIMNIIRKSKIYKKYKND